MAQFMWPMIVNRLPIPGAWQICVCYLKFLCAVKIHRKFFTTASSGKFNEFFVFPELLVSLLKIT